MKTTKIALLLVVMFATLIAYKYISSRIDEQRQKTILNEKYEIELRGQEQLDQCIAQTQVNLHRKYAEALQMTADAIRRGEVSQPVGSAQLHLQEQIADKEAEAEKQECYKRYK